MHSLINSDFDAIKAAQLLNLTGDEVRYVERNRSYWNGDHWLDGAGYLGPKTSVDDPRGVVVMARIKELFTSKNVVLEVTSRQSNSNLGKHPDIQFDVRRPRRKVPAPDFTPPADQPNAQPPMIDEPLTEEEQQAIEEATNLVQNFLKDKKALKALREVFQRRLWGGRSYARLFVPSKFTQAPATLEEAAERLILDTPDITAARVDKDPLTHDAISVVKFQTARERQEYAYELAFVDDAGRTFVGVLSQGNADNPQAALAGSAAGSNALLPEAVLSQPLSLKNHLPVFELAGKPIITDQVIQNNALLNLALTMAGHVLVESGFSEMAITNVSLDVEEVKDSKAPGGRREVVKPIKRGAGVINNFVGIAQQDAQGNEILTTPGVHYKEPTPIEVHVSGKELAYRNILEECHQLHALIAGDATPSGESRKQALEDFVAACLDFKEEIDALGKWLCETVLYLAAAQIGQSDRYTQLKAVFDSKIYVGTLSVEEQNALLAQVEKKLRSRKNARAVLGIPDSDAEEEQIKREMALSAQPQPEPDPGTGNNPPAV